ncbi:hypothetical protein BOTCAL_0054g00220 [Botryotinia calthae]|uniref:Uncharacterized protein n=1 Tax=Botryotinia calthae TaxID=38488 RepID=A0A4Y8DAQ7_9HELO|nr:hypothetical protein BOTCAL_0054g00220 [Botryotinia calthae]
MPPITRSKSPVKKTSADQNQASSASSISKNIAPVANMRSPAKKAPAQSGQVPSGGNNALSDAMIPTLEPLSPSKRKRSAKTISGDEGVGEQPSEPMKRTRVERSDAPRSHPTSGQSDLAATTYPQVERVVLGLEDTPVFGTAGGAPKEEVDAGSSTSTSSPKPVESTAAAPVLVGEENGVTAKAPISAVNVTAGQADSESVVEQLTPHSDGDLTGPLAATEAEAHLPAAPQDCSSSDLEVAKEELGSPKIGTTNTCKCDEYAAKFAEMEKKIEATEKQEVASRAENDKIRESMKQLLQSNHQLRLERSNIIQLAEEHPRIIQENQRLAKMVRSLKDDKKQLIKRNDELVETVEKFQVNVDEIWDIAEKFKAKGQKFEEAAEDYRIAVNVFNKKLPELTQDQEDLQLTKELLRIEAAKNNRSFAADEVVPSIETSDPDQGGMSHGNHGSEKLAQEGRSRRYRTPTPHECEERAQEDRSRRYRTPTPGCKGNNNDVVDSDDENADSLPQLGASDDVFTSTQQSDSASGLAGFRGSYRWECYHDRGYNGNRCNHCGVHVLTEENLEFNRDRSVAPAASVDDLYGASDNGRERELASPSYEPAEAVINETEAVTNSQDESQPENSRYLSENQDDEDDDQRDESQHVDPTTLSGNEDYEDDEGDEGDDQRDISGHNGIPDLPDYEDSEDDNQQDHQEFPHPAEAVEETFSAPPNVSSYFKPAHPGWGSSSVLLTQAAVTAPAPSTPSLVSESATVALSPPTVITRSGAAVQFGAATTFGVSGSTGSSFRFGSTNSFGVPALSANSPSVVVSPEENDAEEDKPAGQEK